MSQDNSNYCNSGSLDKFAANKLQLVESNTSHLMDALFQELEQSLNQNTSLPSNQKLLKSSMQPVCQPGTAVPTLKPSFQSLLVLPYSQQVGHACLVVASTTLSHYSLEQPYLDRLDPSPPQPGNNRFFLCLACASVAVTLLLWVGSQVKLNTGKAVPTVSQVSSRPMVSATNPLTSRSQSVDLKDVPTTQQQASAKQTASTTRTQPAKVAQPAKPRVAPHVIPVPAKVRPERVFVPVYPSAKQEPASQPQVVYKATVASVSSPASPSIGQTTHTLVGVLEFGDRSAALVDVNHVTRRIHIGEMLTPDGWKLTKVTDQKAVLQRGGKLRSVYVGQGF